MIDTRRAWHSTNIQENANVGLEDSTESIEEPSMGVDFFLIFFFETKDDLNGDNPFFCPFDFQIGIDGNLLRG